MTSDQLRLASDQLRTTSLPEYLDSCHKHLFLGLKVGQTESSTKGGFTSAERKRRPLHIRHWTSFGATQLNTWDKLMTLEFMNGQHFHSKSTIRDIGEAHEHRTLGSELDLHHFARIAVQDPVTSVITALASNTVARQRFGLRGTILFENHANTLRAEDGITTSLKDLNLSVQRGRRRSPRLAERDQRDLSRQASEPLARKTLLPPADQFCVYNTSDTSRSAAFIIEYKPPHKFTLDTIKIGLQDMDVDEIMIERVDDGNETKCRRAVAAVITQTYSYMVAAGLAHGYIYTGEAFIFLHVANDPQTVNYYLATPGEDVGTETGWSATTNGSNRLHLTAVGQALAFTLHALQTPQHEQTWLDMVERLPVWEIVIDQLFEDLPTTKEMEDSIFIPTPRRDNDFTRSTPVRLRHRSVDHNHRRPSGKRPESDSDSDCHSGSQPGLPPPSTRSLPQSLRGAQETDKFSEAGAKYGSETEQRRKYCTHACLQGLLGGGSLDPCCPNVVAHGTENHCVSQSKFLRKIKSQLTRSLDVDVESIGLHGARGAFFKITMTELGYTMAAKLCPAYFEESLRHEEAVYYRLRSIQGVHIPVCLGRIQLTRAYRYDGIAHLTEVLFLSFAGNQLRPHSLPMTVDKLTAATAVAVQSIHAQDVLHGDAALRNLVWDEFCRRPFIIDFDRATLLPQRSALSTVSGNLKRKRPTGLKGGEDASKLQLCRSRELWSLSSEMERFLRPSIKAT